MREYQLQAFPRETLKDIAREFRAYFRRKKRLRLTPSEARALIDYEAGPGSDPYGGGAIDYSRPRVTGGGRRRPTAEAVQAIYDSRATDNEEANEWDAVFDELMRRLERTRGAEALVLMRFRDGHSDFVVCDELGIERSTYYKYRRVVLEQAGVIALKKGVLKHWKC